MSQTRPPGVPESRYARREVLGAGAMGEVVACLDARLGRVVAVKSVLREFASNPWAEGMLEREAQITASLEHPHIIPVYDAGTDPLGPYYVMRVVDQPNLWTVLAGLATGDPAACAAYSFGKLLRYFIQVCHAIAFAHSRGVIHCDLKPANILLGPFGEVLIVDWGLACRTSEGAAFRGGTPGYIPPERMAPGHCADERTDVFALGAILYEIACLRRAFEHAALSDVERATGAPRAAIPPRTRAPERRVPVEIEEIVMKAIALDPADRFATAGEMATALEGFLEGTRELERRRARCDALTAEGDDLAESYLDLRASRPVRAAELAAMRAAVAPHEGPDRKAALWDAEHGLSILDGLTARTLHAAEAAYEQALDEVPGDAAARRGLARLYAGELERARDRRDEFDRVYYEELAHQFSGAPDDARGAHLNLGVTDGPAEIVVHRLGERLRVLCPVAEAFRGPAPARAPLEPASYVAVVRAADGGEIRFPFLIRGEGVVSYTLDLRAARGVLPGEVLVYEGPALAGGDGAHIEERELRRVDVACFAIGERPVRFDEYLDFLTALRRRDPALAERFAPATQDGARIAAWSGDRFEAIDAAGWAGRAELLALPVAGITPLAAEAYAAWRAEETGLALRLPTEDEWEKAARGVDGRTFPWGDAFDASFCKMRESRRGAARPEPSGAFALDVSPYGVRDMAGGVADWVVAGGAHRRFVARGGAWCDGAHECRSTSRRWHDAEDRSARVGFRLARSIPTRTTRPKLSGAITALLRGG